MFRTKCAILISLSLIAAVISGTAIAWPSMPSLPSSSTAPAPAATAGGGADGLQGKLVTNFIAGQTSVANGQVDMAKAFGLKDLALSRQTEADALKSCATDTCIQTETAKSAAAEEAIQKAMAAAAALTADGQASFTKALPEYAVGLVELRKLVPDCQNFIKAANQEIAAAPLTSLSQTKSKLQIGTYIATNTPGYVGSVAQSTMDLVKYATAHKISVPTDVMSSLNP